MALADIADPRAGQRVAFLRECPHREEQTRCDPYPRT
jgi:hypothetical protein